MNKDLLVVRPHAETKSSHHQNTDSSLTQDVTNFVKSCSVCAQTPRELPAGLLEPLPIPQRPWSHLSVDFVTELPSSNRFTTILVIIDRFSKSCHLVHLTGLYTAMETTKASIPNLQNPRGHCVWPRSPVHFPSMAGILQTARYQRQPHLRLSPTSQWTSWKTQSGDRALPEVYLLCFIPYIATYTA